MLNLFEKKTKNNSFDLSNAKGLNFFSDTALDISNKEKAPALKKNVMGETRHYLPATKE